MNNEQTAAMAAMATHDEELAALLAGSKRAFENYAKAMGEVDASLIGHWFGIGQAGPKVERMRAEGWAFYRCGVVGDPHAEARAHTLIGHGWQPAPAGTRCVGFEMDGERGKYITCPPEVYGRMKAVERMARSKRSRADLESLSGLRAELEQMERDTKGAVEIEEFSPKLGEASGDDVARQVAEARIKSRGRNG